MSSHPSRRSFLAASAGAAMVPLALRPGPAFGQEFPSKPITWIVPYGTGGATSAFARLVGAHITDKYGTPVIVDNRPGAGGLIGINAVLQAPADGSTLGYASNSFTAVLPHLSKAAKFNPLADLVPIGLAGDVAAAVIVNPSVPANTMQELIAYGRANSGKLNYGSTGIGSVGHLSGEYLQRRAGFNMVHVPYRGGADLVTNLISGSIDLVFGPDAAPYVLSKRLRALAILGPRRWDKLPDVPSTDEAGLPGWAIQNWHFVWANGKTPPALLARMNEVINEALLKPEIIRTMNDLGLFPRPATISELTERLKADQAAFGKLIKEVGLQPE